MKKLLLFAMAISLFPAALAAQSVKMASTSHTEKQVGDAISKAVIVQSTSQKERMKRFDAHLDGIKDAIRKYPTQMSAIMDAHKHFKAVTAHPNSKGYLAYQAVFLALEDLASRIQALPEENTRKAVKDVFNTMYFFKETNKEYSLAELANMVSSYMQENSSGPVEFQAGNFYDDMTGPQITK